jgi:salicylate synthase
VHGAQHELGEVCASGSVLVEEFMGVRQRGSVQHLASRVTGRLAPDRNGWHALAGLFPAVTASGLPKAAACEAIHRYEPGERGLYSGVVLTADADGALDAALVLRTVFQQGGRTWLRAGAGIVEQSDPARELEETREKLRSISRFLVPVAGHAQAAEHAQVGAHVAVGAQVPVAERVVVP